MPIPLLIPPGENKTQPGPKGFQLVSVSGSAASPARSLLLFPRAMAHAFDLCLILGASFYLSRLLSLFLLSFHMQGIQGSGRLGRSLFLEALSYGQSQVFLACVALISAGYFVGMPIWTGRTLGHGLCGLKVEGFDGQEAGPRAHGLRFLACLLGYATVGLLPLAGLRSREGRLFQDYFSASRVVREE